MLEEDDSRSMCAMVYFSVWISSVRGAEKETFLADGNMGLVVVKDLRLRTLGSGPLTRIDLLLYGNRYGTGGEMESVDDAEVAYASDEVVEVLEADDVTLSDEEVRKGVGA